MTSKHALAYLLLAVLFSATVIAQVPSSKPIAYSKETLANLKKVQRASLDSSYAYERTRYLTNNIGPRLSGSPQAARAVEYVADEMRKLGLKVRLQKVMVPHWVRGVETGELVEFQGMAKGTVQKLSLTALGGSSATPDSGLEANVVLVNDFDELFALERKAVEGKIVFYNFAYDREMAKSGKSLDAYGLANIYRGRGVVEAAKLGAAAVVIRSVGSSENRLAHTGAISFEEGVKVIPAAAVSYEDGELIEYLAQQGNLKMRLVLTPKTLADEISYNVIADLEGSEKPEEIVVVSGHLDSWDLGTGALDDAVGVAMAMQVPFVMKQLGIRPKRTIRVVAFMNEENGFRGARKYAEEADISNHFAAIESDLGAGHPVGYQFAGKSEAVELLSPITAILVSQQAGFLEQKANVSSDISLLTLAGVPSFAPIYDSRTYFDYHHNAADTFDKVDPVFLSENASLMAVLAYGLANLEQPLPR
jgi:hypothetical protein